MAGVILGNTYFGSTLYSSGSSTTSPFVARITQAGTVTWVVLGKSNDATVNPYITSCVAYVHNTHVHYS